MALTGKMQQAVMLLLEGRGTSDIARQLSTSRETIARWRRRPDFQAALNAAQAEKFEESMQLVTLATKKSVIVLINALDSDAAPWSAKIRAALGLIQLSVDINRLQEVDKLISDLEGRYHDRHG